MVITVLPHYKSGIYSYFIYILGIGSSIKDDSSEILDCSGNCNKGLEVNFCSLQKSSSYSKPCTTKGCHSNLQVKFKLIEPKDIYLLSFEKDIYLLSFVRIFCLYSNDSHAMIYKNINIYIEIYDTARNSNLTLKASSENVVA